MTHKLFIISESQKPVCAVHIHMCLQNIQHNNFQLPENIRIYPYKKLLFLKVSKGLCRTHVPEHLTPQHNIFKHTGYPDKLCAVHNTYVPEYTKTQHKITGFIHFKKSNYFRRSRKVCAVHNTYVPEYSTTQHTNFQQQKVRIMVLILAGTSLHVAHA